MASVSPVALRFVTEQWKTEVPSPPHDALSVEARRHHLREHPRSYLGVTRAPEDGGDVNGSATAAGDALQAGRQTLVGLLDEQVFGPVNGPTFYVYRLVDGEHHQSGLVCGVATTDYDCGTVRIHERINQSRADHLARHLQVVGAQSSPIAMAFRAAPAVTEVMARTANANEPFLDIVDDDGLRQQLWRVPEEEIAEIQGALHELPLYLIDGHHRAAASSTDLRESGEPEAEHRMLSVLFPYEELRNQAFHRVLTGMDAAVLEDALRQRFPVRSTDNPEVVVGRAPTELALAVPSGPEETGQILRWILFDIPFDSASPDALENIDPIRLGTHVISSILETDESGSDTRLSYRPGQADLETLGQLTLKPGEVLFLMRPVSMRTLMEASDEGNVMPPKSTYFQPKVRSGLFVRLIDPTLEDPVRTSG